MASLNNPVNLQNIIDRFADYVVVAANSGIVWGLDNKPFPEMPDYYFGGFTSGKSISIQGQGYQGYRINASGSNAIYDGILLETFRYSNIRNMRALLFMTTTYEQTGQFPEEPDPFDPDIVLQVSDISAFNVITSGAYIYDQTAKAHLNVFNYLYSPDSNRLARGQIVAGNRITRAGLEDLFDRARSLYYDFLDDTVTVVITVCHGSCHYSCHNSRSRR
jgi:hypothetical protein